MHPREDQPGANLFAVVDALQAEIEEAKPEWFREIFTDWKWELWTIAESDFKTSYANERDYRPHEVFKRTIGVSVDVLVTRATAGGRGR